MLREHGTVTEVDEDEYDTAVAHQTRAFASVATAFFGFAAVLSRYGPLLRTGERGSTPA